MYLGLCLFGHLIRENCLNQCCKRQDEQKYGCKLPWLLNIVVNVAEEDEADARADDDAVAEIIALG